MPVQGTELHDVIKDLARRTEKPTQDAQAKKLGISDTSLAAYLAGTQIPRESTLVKMLNAVGVPPRDHGKYLKIRQMAEVVPHTRAHGQGSQLPPTVEGDLPAVEDLPAKTPASRKLTQRLWAWVGAPILLGLVVWGGFVLFASPPSEPSTTTAVTSSPPASPLQCSLVNVLSSPVYVEIGDPKPVKSKVMGDRVRTLAVPHRTGPDGVAYQAVSLPNRRDSPNGVGWMRAADLRPDPRQCADLGRHP